MTTKAKAKRERSKKDSPAVNRPTMIRDWWLVDVAETRTLKVRAVGPRQARDMAARVMMDLYPPTSFNGESDVVTSFAHTVKCGEGRSTRDRR